jgi:hypothetical protein
VRKSGGIPIGREIQWLKLRFAEKSMREESAI